MQNKEFIIRNKGTSLTLWEMTTRISQVIADCMLNTKQSKQLFSFRDGNMAYFLQTTKGYNITFYRNNKYLHKREGEIDLNGK